MVRNFIPKIVDGNPKSSIFFFIYQEINPNSTQQK